MDSIFAAPGLFNKLCEIKGYRSFTFGGVTGQVVSTNVYHIWIKFYFAHNIDFNSNVGQQNYERVWDH